MTTATLKKAKRTGIILMAAFVLISCKKNPEPQPETGGPLKLTEYVSGSDFVRITYNNSGEIRTISLSNDEYSSGGAVTYDVSLLPGKKINELNGNNGIRIKPVYDGNNIVKSIAYMGNNKAYETTYEYADGHLRSTVISLVENNVATPIIKLLSYYDGAGNPTTIDTYLTNPFTGEMINAGFVINSYDNKINPFAEYKDLMLVLLLPVSQNNVTMESYFDTDITPQEVIETEYSYNSKGFPVTAVISQTSPGKEPAKRMAKYTYK